MKKGTRALIIVFCILDLIALVTLLIYLLKIVGLDEKQAVVSISNTTEILISEEIKDIPEVVISDEPTTSVSEEVYEEELPKEPSDASIYNIPFDDGYIFPDLSDYDFVFIGDSIFDMSFSDTSMPRQLEVYTNSRVYNLAKNMSCAANGSNSQITLTGLTECFVNGKETGYSETRSFNRDIVRFANDKHKGKKMVIVFNHCINDYTFSSHLYNEADSNDINSYEGALRANIAKIKNAYPKAELVYMEPYILGISNNCNDPNTFGYTLDDYIASLEKIAGEYGIKLFNLRSYAFFAEYRDGYLLGDCIHPNDMASKTMARLFCDFVQNNIQ